MSKRGDLPDRVSRVFSLAEGMGFIVGSRNPGMAAHVVELLFKKGCNDVESACHLSLLSLAREYVDSRKAARARSELCAHLGILSNMFSFFATRRAVSSEQSQILIAIIRDLFGSKDQQLRIAKAVFRGALADEGPLLQRNRMFVAQELGLIID